MSFVVDAVPTEAGGVTSDATGTIRIALLGVGHVGGALAALARTDPRAKRFTITSGLVRDVTRDRPGANHLPLASDPLLALDGDPDIVIEALGGIEPARTLLLTAIERGIPVVTANKSLLAAHGSELLAAASRHGVPLRYEAAVLAGVPFLGTFSRRPFARALTGLSGIVNGTTNFIVSKMSTAGTDFHVALAEAQRCGYAEPDPSNDVEGVDAAEKLCVLLRHFRDWSVLPHQLERSGIETLSGADLDAAGEFGGALKPIVHADWMDGRCSAFVGPAFVPGSHPLSRITGVQNAILLRNETHGELLFAGPGAGPTVTAATLLDDATEIRETNGTPTAIDDSDPVRVDPPLTEWFVRLPVDPSSFGIELKRTVQSGRRNEWIALTERCSRERVAAALHECESRVGRRGSAFRALDQETRSAG